MLDDKIAKILNLPHSDKVLSKDYIYSYKINGNIQQFTKTPVKCHLCKEQIMPMLGYRSVGAVYFHRARGKVKQVTKWRKTCGDCPQFKEIVKLWNAAAKKNNKERKKCQ